MSLFVYILLFWLIFALPDWLAKLKKKRPTPLVTEAEQTEYLEALRQDRLIGDFVLTGAALPGKINPIVPTEGYRIFKEVEDMPPGGVRIIAAVSAEKIAALLQALIDIFEGLISLSIMDFHTDEKQTIDYIAYDKEKFVAKKLIEDYKQFIINNGELGFSMFSTETVLEVRLDPAKHVVIYAMDIEPVQSVLHSFAIENKPELRFFPEGEYFYYNEFARTDTLFRLVEQLQFHEKKYYNKS